MAPESYVTVPRDLSRIKTKILFNLTRRQLVCFGMAAAVGLPLFFLVRKAAGTTAASMTMVIVMMPFFLLAMYEKDGQPLEKVAWNYIRQAFLRPKVRPYQTENRYVAYMRQKEAEEEVRRIVSEARRREAARVSNKGRKTKNQRNKKKSNGNRKRS